MFIAHCLHRDAEVRTENNSETGNCGITRNATLSTGAPAQVACLCESEHPSKVNDMSLASYLARWSNSAVPTPTAFSGEHLGKRLESLVPETTEPATPGAARQRAKAQMSAAQALTVVCASCGDEHHAACVGADALFATSWICIRCENENFARQHQASVAAAASSSNLSTGSPAAAQKAVNEGTGFLPGGNAVVRAARLI